MGAGNGGWKWGLGMRLDEDYLHKLIDLHIENVTIKEQMTSYLLSCALELPDI